MFSPILYSTNLQNILTKFYFLFFESFYEVKYTHKKDNLTIHIEKIEIKIRNNKENWWNKLVKTRGELIVYVQKKLLL